jgi:hypothetical protein
MAVSGLLMEIDVIHPDYFAPMHINNLLIEQITSKEKKSFGSIERWPIGNRGRRANPAVYGRNG